MKTGLFVSHNTERMEEALERQTIPKGYDAGIFLHGVCDVFAAALHQIHGYDIEFMIDENDENGFDDLVHSYCVSEDEKGEEVFIDVRGITDSEEELFEPFEDFFSQPKRYCISEEEIMAANKARMTEPELEWFLSQAMHMIHSDPERYNVECGKR